MAIESTAINALVYRVTSKPLPGQDSVNDWMSGRSLFECAPPAEPQGVESTRPVGFDPLPPNQYARKGTHWDTFGKLLLLPIGMFAIVIVVLGVYFAKRDSQPTAAATVASKPHERVAMAPKPAQQTQIATPGDVPPPAEPSTPAIEPAKPAEPAPKQAEPAPKQAEPAPKQAAPAPIEPAKPAEPAPKQAEPAPIESAKPAEPALNIEPGSPASRFLNAAPVEPTIPTVAPKSGAATRGAPKLVAAPKPAAAAPAPRQDAAAKANANVTSLAKRAKPVRRVAAMKASIGKDEDSDDEPAGVHTIGKGVLMVSSTPPLEVWVDGRTKAMTPLRVILLAGKHQVTLFDKEDGKARTFDVVIKSDETTKVAKSFR